MRQHNADFNRHAALGVAVRELAAEEITAPSHRRGTIGAASEPVPLALERLNTQAWQRFLQRRGPLPGSQAEQLINIGLAVEVDGLQ